MATQNVAAPEEKSDIKMDINKVPIVIKIDRAAIASAMGIILFLFLVVIWGMLFTHLNTIEQTSKQNTQQLSDMMTVVSRLAGPAHTAESAAAPPASTPAASTPSEGNQSGVPGSTPKPDQSSSSSKADE
jgi:hypothetical protein